MKLLVLLAVLVTSVAFAGTGETPQMPKEFDFMKNLVGTWEGKNTMHGKEETTTVTYRLTSGGTAVAEELAKDTPHEMLSVYHKEGKNLAMTHYCAMGNAPVMSFKKADDKSMTFEMTKPLGVTSMKEPHMHAITLTLVDPNTLKQEWVSYKDGKKADTAVFTFKRKN